MGLSQSKITDIEASLKRTAFVMHKLNNQTKRNLEKQRELIEEFKKLNDAMVLVNSSLMGSDENVAIATPVVDLSSVSPPKTGDKS